MAITLRENPNIENYWGTLTEPKTFVFPTVGIAQLKTTLGYEAQPSTDVWRFEVKKPLRFSVNRISDDPYIVHVAVALVDGNNRRVAILVHSADGIGDEIILEPGVYKIVAALGMPERLCNVLLRIETRWIDLSMRGVATGSIGGFLWLNRTGMRGLAYGIARSIAADLKTHQMVGIADGVNEAYLRLRYPYLVGEAWGVGEGLAHILHSLVGLAVGKGVAGGRISGLRLRGLAWGAGPATARDAMRHLGGLAWGNGRATTTMIVWTRGRLAGYAYGSSTARGKISGGGGQHAKGLSNNGRQALDVRPTATPPAGGWTAKDLAQGYARLTVPLAQAGAMTLPFNPDAQEPVVLRGDPTTTTGQGAIEPTGLHVLDVRPVSLAGAASGGSV